MNENDYKRILNDRKIKYRPTLNLPRNLTFGIEIQYENVQNELISNLLYEEEIFDINFSHWINKPEIDLTYEEEEMVAELISYYGDEIIHLTKVVWNGIKMK